MTKEDIIFRILSRGASFKKRQEGKENKTKQQSLKGIQSKKDNNNENEKNKKNKDKKKKSKGDNIRVKGIESLDTFKSFKYIKSINKPLYKNIPFKKPTAIQTQTFSAFQSGRDIIAIAPTGSGKTIAYLLGSICNKGRILILTLNKELVNQVFKEALRITRDIPDLSCTISTSRLVDNPRIIISTPESILKIINGRDEEEGNDNSTFPSISTLSILQSINVIILDEADRLLSNDYLDSIDSILSNCSPKAQKALFSATISSGIESIANTFCLDPIRISVGMPMSATCRIDQKLIYVKDEGAKLLALCQMMTLGEIKVPALIFCNDLQSSKKLYKELASSVSNLMVAIYQKNNGSKLLDLLRSNKLWYLIVSDDQLSRGIDIPNLYTVINYAFPINTCSYIHRVGRAGRANFRDDMKNDIIFTRKNNDNNDNNIKKDKGTAITFFTDNDDVRMIVNVIRQSGGSVPEWMLSIKRPKKMNKGYKKRTIKKLTRNKYGKINRK